MMFWLDSLLEIVGCHSNTVTRVGGRENYLSTLEISSSSNIWALVLWCSEEGQGRDVSVKVSLLSQSDCWTYQTSYHFLTSSFSSYCDLQHIYFLPPSWMTVDVDWYNKYHIIDKISWKESKINIPVFSTLLYCDIVLIASCNQLDHEVLFRKHLVLTQPADRQKIYHPVLMDLIWPFSFFLLKTSNQILENHNIPFEIETERSLISSFIKLVMFLCEL